MKNEKNAAFTLIELLVVVLIIGILAAVAVPQYQKAVAKAHYMQLVTAGKSLKEGMEEYYMANGTYPTLWSELVIRYPGCSDGGMSPRWLLVCQDFVVDMFAGLDANLCLYDIPDKEAVDEAVASGDSSALKEKMRSRYIIWLDQSEYPGKTSCESNISGLCASLGY